MTFQPNTLTERTPPPPGVHPKSAGGTSSRSRLATKCLQMFSDLMAVDRADRLVRRSDEPRMFAHLAEMNAGQIKADELADVSFAQKSMKRLCSLTQFLAIAFVLAFAIGLIFNGITGV